MGSQLWSCMWGGSQFHRHATNTLPGSEVIALSQNFNQLRTRW